MTGTLINIGTVVVGSLIGVSIGSRLPERMNASVHDALGLLTMAIGFQMGFESKNILIVMGALLLGAIVGEFMRISDGLDWLGNSLQSLFGKEGNHNISEGFVTASLVFCIGPMAILGSIQDGLTGDYHLLAVKAMLDGFAAIAFSATLGWGVMLSSLSVLLYQGSITLFAGVLDQVLTEPMTAEMTATGGLIIVGIGLRLLRVKEIRLANFLPALAIAPLLVVVIPWVKGLW